METVERKHYIAAHRDEGILAESSSGGMFTLFAEYIFKKNGVVFGAVFDSRTKTVCHKKAEKIEDIEKMRKSKYVWSDFTQCFNDIDNAIADDRWILFTGTPCQCYSVKNKYRGYDKIFIVDIYCHGTGESSYFTNYLDVFLPEADRIDFRWHRKDEEANYIFCAWGKGEKILEEEYNENIYTSLYVNSSVLRRGCFDCAFATKQHVSDITIGDFDYKELAKNKYGIPAKHPSIVTVNTQQGISIWSDCSKDIYCKEIDKEDEAKIQSYYRDHADIKGSWGYNIELRKKFDSNYAKFGFRKAALLNQNLDVVGRVDVIPSMDWHDVYIYGCGEAGRATKRIFQNLYPDLEIKGFIVSNKKQLDIVDGIKVFGIDEIKQYHKDVNVFVGVSDLYKEEIYSLLKKYGFENVI